MPYDFLQDSDGLNLRNYQLKAIEAVEQALADGKKTALLSMATGTGNCNNVSTVSEMRFCSDCGGSGIKNCEKSFAAKLGWAVPLSYL